MELCKQLFAECLNCKYYKNIENHNFKVVYISKEFYRKKAPGEGENKNVMQYIIGSCMAWLPKSEQPWWEMNPTFRYIISFLNFVKLRTVDWGG